MQQLPLLLLLVHPLHHLHFLCCHHLTHAASLLLLCLCLQHQCQHLSQGPSLHSHAHCHENHLQPTHWLPLNLLYSACVPSSLLWWYY
jgi:hypothetical protein